MTTPNPTASDIGPTDARQTDTTIRLGVLGCGHVGGALIRLVDAHAGVIAQRTGVQLVVTRVGVRDTSRDRDVPVAASVFTDDAASVVDSDDVDLVVELIGGTDPAQSLVVAALDAHKPVVTANKELIAHAGVELFDRAAASGVDFLFEASVGGGIPLIRPLRESVAGDRIRRVLGIVNGTTNYILTRMSESGAGFDEALAEAQALGYAEADPTADIEGFDAAAKAAIVASIAFGALVTLGDVHREGITDITIDDIDAARKLGYVVKLLAIADEQGDDVAVRVHPAMVPDDHPLAAVRESFNAVFIEGDAVGELMLYGRGAGGGPTASAVLGDIVDAARNLAGGHPGAAMGTLASRRIRPIGDVESQFYVPMEVIDRPGVLAAIAGVFGRHGVSIKLMQQHGLGDEAQLNLVTHPAAESDFTATLDELRGHEAVKSVGRMLRVIGDDT